jgi:NADPH:quinone reductase-like Zn-dependent oxidoreductase
MKAIVQERYGSLEKLALREVPRPSVAPDEVLVRVRAASAHPDVWHFLTGRPYILRILGAGLVRPKNPIPGTDMSGVVESVGKDVTRFQAGDEVFGETTRKRGWTTGGAYAEFVSVRDDQLAPKPTNVTFEQAASVPTSGLIALQNLRGAGRALPEKRVLVNGAGGGVGSLALQITKAHRAHVTAVDSTAKLGMLRALGADRVIDYTEEDFTRGGDRYDLIFDVPGNHPFSACRRVLEPHGRYVLIGHEGFGASGTRALGIFPQFFKLVFLSRFVRQLRGPAIALPTPEETIVVLRDLLEAGKVTPIIDSTYALGNAREALRHMIEDELLGKVIITVE